MQIGLVVPRFPVASETFVADQISGLLERGHDVEIFADRPRAGPDPDLDSGRRPDDEDHDLVRRTRYWPEPPPWILRAIGAARLIVRGADERRRLLRAVDVRRYGLEALSLSILYRADVAASAGSFDAVIAHFGPAARLARRLREIGALDGRLVAVFHGFDLSRELRDRGRDTYADLFRDVDLVLPVCDYWRRRLLELGAPADRIVVHPMGVDCDRLSHVPPRQGSDAPVRLISVGRLVEKKGFDYGIRAVAELVRRGRSVTYEIIGEGPLRADLEGLVEALGLGNRTVLRGWRRRQEVAAELGRADVLLAPSVTASDGDMEGIPVVLMEAMARGLPVVSTLHSGIPELVRDGETGYTVPERDPGALTDRLGELVDLPDQRQRMGRAGRRLVETEFDLATLNARLERLLAELCES